MRWIEVAERIVGERSQVDHRIEAARSWASMLRVSFSSIGTSAMSPGRIGAAPIEIAVVAHHLVPRLEQHGGHDRADYPLCPVTSTRMALISFSSRMRRCRPAADAPLQWSARPRSIATPCLPLLLVKSRRHWHRHAQARLRLCVRAIAGARWPHLPSPSDRRALVSHTCLLSFVTARAGSTFCDAHAGKTRPTFAKPIGADRRPKR